MNYLSFDTYLRYIFIYPFEIFLLIKLHFSSIFFWSNSKIHSTTEFIRYGCCCLIRWPRLFVQPSRIVMLVLRLARKESNGEIALNATKLHFPAVWRVRDVSVLREGGRVSFQLLRTCSYRKTTFARFLRRWGKRASNVDKGLVRGRVSRDERGERFTPRRRFIRESTSWRRDEFASAR